MGQHLSWHTRPATSVALLLFAVLVPYAGARATTSQEAELVVAGWLIDNAEPFGVPLGREIVGVETSAETAGEPAYYVVRLDPSGFVIVPADDRLEPILAFADGQTGAPAFADPLADLVTLDLRGRLAALDAAAPGQLQAQATSVTQSRWYDLVERATLPQPELSIAGKQAISDVRVAPFVQTRWAQETACSQPTYNYYTPNHYPAGCAATAMAQLICYYRRPAGNVGRQPFTIQVSDVDQTAYTRGGDGVGGPYRWNDMVVAPDCQTRLEQRQAIGALCYDAGVSLGTSYGRDASSADAFEIGTALRRTFGYSNAVAGANHGENLGSGLAGMINPNLDAHHPVILGITNSVGHGVVVDGYGYDASTSARTLYHHVNMGWAGYGNVWYNLPNILDYPTILMCLYNIFAEGDGEIISGRVTDAAGRPIAGAVVTATRRTRAYADVTNENGIYALVQVPSASTYAMKVERAGFVFSRQTVTTGTSQDMESVAGNRWAVDFVGRLVGDADNDGDVDFVDFAQLAVDWRTATTAAEAATVTGYLDLVALAGNWLAGVTPRRGP